MALNETKFLLAWIVVSAVFISLSVSGEAEVVEGHRCYWCGPLAEQVHRSQRAASCNGDKSKVTICDEDLPYCAIVATSPPYVESRFCIKLYQDECYSLFCNSTKTWRITCPCRGELCNGVNTKRETEAFEALLKHNMSKLMQNKRFKRALISKVSFIGVSTRKNKIDNATEENKDVHNETMSANIVTDDDDKNEQAATATEVVDSKSEDNQITSTHEAVTEPTIEKAETTKEVTNSESFETTKAVVEHNESAETTVAEVTAQNGDAKETNLISEIVSTDKPINDSNTATEAVVENKATNGPLIQIDIPSPNIDTGDLKTEIIVMSSEVPTLANDTKTNDMVTKITENIPKEQAATLEIKPTVEEMKVTPETTIMPVKVTTATELDKAKKSSEKLPTAEALQHNDTPTTKMTEQMSTSTITMTLNTHIDVATQATLPRNNTAVRVDAHILTIVIGIILHF